HHETQHKLERHVFWQHQSAMHANAPIVHVQQAQKKMNHQLDAVSLKPSEIQVAAAIQRFADLSARYGWIRKETKSHDLRYLEPNNQVRPIVEILHAMHFPPDPCQCQRC